MAGEIRQKLEQLRAARGVMVKSLSDELDGVIREVAAVQVDGLKAAQLPRAELDGYREEIREIREEFAALTNGGPSGPLPSSAATANDSPPPSDPPVAPAAPDLVVAPSDPAPQSDATLPEPHASWAGQKQP